jgi:hypothetical protein
MLLLINIRLQQRQLKLSRLLTLQLMYYLLTFQLLLLLFLFTFQLLHSLHPSTDHNLE